MKEKVLLEQLLVIDIETVSEKRSFDELSPEWRMLWDEKTRWTRPDDMDAESFYPERAGVMAEFAKVICIGVGFFHRQEEGLSFRVKAIHGHDEKKLLEQFFETVTRFENRKRPWHLAGHNIREFDIPFLCRRMLINRLPLPPFLDLQSRKPWETNLIDTFQYWRFGDYKQFTSLKLLAAALGVPSPKDDIDGGQVGSVYWQHDDLERIARYCCKDVVTVANILLCFQQQPQLEPEQVIFSEMNLLNA